MPASDLPDRARPVALSSARWSVGVDGGGTGTRARLQDQSGRTLGFGSAGPSGLGQGVAQAWRHVEQAMARAFAAAGLKLPPPDQIAIGLGLAGAGVPAQRAAFLAADPGHALCLLETDATTQLIGVHGGKPGIVVACGTGSVAAARSVDGTVLQVGGWGFPAGDEGSGAWLGLRAVQQAQAELDGRSPATALSASVRSVVGADAAAVLGWGAAAGQGAYAALAPLVFGAADAGDVGASVLLQHAADELARLVKAIDTAAPPSLALLPIVVVGNVGERLSPRWADALQARIVAAVGDSADGALRLLQSAAATGPLP